MGTPRNVDHVSQYAKGVLIITCCTNRKRATDVPSVSIRMIPRATTKDVAKQWMKKVRMNSATMPATNLYVGRGFAEAQACKALANGRLFIVSAGLGLIEDRTPVPHYDLTIVPSPANVATRITGEPFSRRAWWGEISRRGGNKRGIAGLITSRPADRFCIALPSAYLDMVADDLARLPKNTARRVRVFSSEDGRRLLPGALKPCWMPYDARLDGPGSPIPGTKADFAQRAMHHFLKWVAPNYTRDVRQDAQAVTKSLRRMKYPARLNRMRLTDLEITKVMHRDFLKVGGQASKMLPHLRRTLNIACEQGRFARLFRELKASHEKSTPTKR